MRNINWIMKLFVNSLVIVGLIGSLLFVAGTHSFAKAGLAFIRQVRTIEVDKSTVDEPAGLIYSNAQGVFYVIDARESRQSPLDTNFIKLALSADRTGSARIAAAINDSINVAYDNKFGRLLMLNVTSNQLMVVRADADGNLLPGSLTRYNIKYLGIQAPQGLVVDATSGALYILDAVGPRIVRVMPSADGSFDAAKMSVIGLQTASLTTPRGLALDPNTDRLFVISSDKTLYELTQSGVVVTTRDLSGLLLGKLMGLVFAPSGDRTDPVTQMSLYMADSGSTRQSAKINGLAAPAKQAATSGSGQIVELSLVQAASLPAGTTLLPASLVHTIDTSNKAWNPSSPDPSGIDYWPLTGRLLIDDSEVEETVSGITYWAGSNIFDSTLSGTLTSTCTTFISKPTSLTSWNNYSYEPTGLAINPSNNRIYITDDSSGGILFEIASGLDGKYCTSDDKVTSVNTTSLYGGSDTEDVAYGNNTIFISGGIDAEVYEFSLGPNGVLGGGDDGPVTHFDTASLGFNDLEGIGYNADQGTLFIVSTQGSDNYLGEVTTSGTLVHAYDLSFMGTKSNLRSDVVYAPSSQNPAVKDIYIACRCVDNNTDPTENDGKIWEVSIGNAGPTATPTKTSTPTSTFTPTNTATIGPSPTSTNTPLPTNTPTNTATSTATNTPNPTATFTSSPTFTPTPPPSSNPLYASFANNGSVGGVSFADEDILRFDGTTWSIYFDGSNVGVGGVDVNAFDVLDANTILMSFDKSVTIGTLSVAPSDVVQFNATSFGFNNTAGSFSMYFNGADVGLSTTNENIDAFHVLPDGRLLISTTGSSSVPGATGNDEDILAFTSTTLGANTSGTWAMYFRGSNVGLADASSEDTDALDVASNGDIYLSTLGSFSVSGVSGVGEDVFVCTPTSLGSVTACNYSPTLYFDGSTWGLAGNSLDGFNLLALGPIPTNTPTNTPTITPTPTNTFTPTPTFTATFTSTATLTATIGPSPTPTNTPTATATFTPTDTPTNTVTPTSTLTATATFTPTATLASGNPLTFTANADSYVRVDKPANNYGTSATVWVDGGTSPAYQGYLKFTVIGVSGTVQSAVLRVFATSGTVNSVTVYGADNSWTETGITWNNKPATLSGAVDNKGPITSGTWVEYNVTVLVSGNGTYTFMLATDNIDSTGFSSREGTQPPQLVITTGP